VAGGLGILTVLWWKAGWPVAKAWLLFGEMLSTVMSFLLLNLLYWLILTPMAFFYRLRAKDFLYLRKREDTYYRTRDHRLSPDDIKNPW
jgi:hypothetical protein